MSNPEDSIMFADKELSFRVVDIMEAQRKKAGERSAELPHTCRCSTIIDDAQLTKRLDKIAYIHGVVCISSILCLLILYLGLEVLSSQTGAILKIVRERTLSG